MSNRSLCAAVAATLFFAPLIPIHADEPAAPATEAAQSAPSDSTAAAPTSSPTAETADAAVDPEPTAKVAKKGKRLEQADSFVAPANWEFDGFVAGGKDQEVRNMFYLNDLVYLNIGKDQGLSTGDRVHFFRRGEKVRDPQTGKLLGFEVRRTASGQVTDRIDAKTCSVRILKASEAVEIGDLVRREE